MTWMNGQIDSLNTTFEMPQNLSSLVNYGISFTASVSVGEWWTATHFGNVFHNAYQGTGEGGGFNRSATSFSLNSQNTFRAGAGYSMELNGFYDGIDMNTHVDCDSRRAMLSFSYRFGDQNLGKRDRRTGSEDIQNRIKGGS